jgi:hypothetical protein
MKRITVAITLNDDYAYSSKYRAVRSAMVNAAVAKVTELDLEIASIDAKLGTPRKAST